MKAEIGVRSEQKLKTLLRTKFIQLKANLNQRIDMTKANNGEVAFITESVPAFKAKAA